MAKHDPVSALGEAEATGTIAAIFEDIRQTMHLPLLTSIWRILAADEAALAAVWQTVKPVFLSGMPAQAMATLTTTTPLPIPARIAPGQLHAAGVTAKDLNTIRRLLAVYNRSNTLNFLALSTLQVETTTTLVVPASESHPQVFAPLPHLPGQRDLSPALWQFLHELNKYGASPDEPGLATVWRHLAHWPGFLAVTHAALAPLQQNGTIAASIQALLSFAETEAARMAPAKNTGFPISPQVQQTINRYVTHPGLVVRMVAIGLGLASWLSEPLESA